MILLYILLIAYILAVNFYAFLLVKSLRDKELQQSEHTKTNDPTNPQGISSPDDTPKFPDKAMSKLFITGLLGGAITIYACALIFKWKRSELLLMVGMPLLAVLNVYVWVLLFRNGFSIFALR